MANNEVFDYNGKVYAHWVKLNDIYKNILIIQSCGSGKSKIFSDIITHHFKNKPVLYVIPKNSLETNAVQKDWWEFPNVEFVTYHSLKTKDPKNYALCVLDEAHHAAAKTWRSSVDKFLYCDSCKVLGLTATEKRLDTIDIAKSLFVENSVTIYSLSVWDCIKYGIFPKPDYILTVLEPDKFLNELNKKAKDYETREKIKMLAETFENENKLENLIERTRKDAKKFIIYTHNIKECETWKERFKNILHTDKIYSVHSKYSQSENDYNIKLFNDYDGDDTIALINVDMLTEGYHLNGVDAVIMLRGTKSHIVYTQQIGRVFDWTRQNYTPIIYDIIGNFDFMKNSYSSQIPIVEDIFDDDSGINIKQEIITIYNGTTHNHNSSNNNIVNNNINSIDINKDNNCVKNKKEHTHPIIEFMNIVTDTVKDFYELKEIIKKNRIIWTDEIIKDLKNPNLTNIFITKKYGISEFTVMKKRKELGVVNSYNIIWTDEIIKDLKNVKLSNRFIAKKYHISADSISKKRKELGVEYIYKRDVWTDEMIKDLKNIDLSNVFLSKKYNISQTSINNKRKDLGIPYLDPRKIIWTDEMIKDLYDIKLSNTFIANKYNISIGTVRNKRKELGLEYLDFRKIIWTDEMIKDLKNPNLTNIFIAKKYGISSSYICNKRKKLGIKK